MTVQRRRRIVPIRPTEPSPATGRVRRRRPWIALLLIVFCVYFLGLFAVQQTRLFQVNRQLALVQAEIRQERETQAELQARVDNLQRDEYVELLAREKLGLVKPGEIPYVAVPAEGLPAAK